MVQDLLPWMPPAFSWYLTLIVVMFLFNDKVGLLYRQVQRFVIILVGTKDRTNNVLSKYARSLLQKQKYKNIVAKLEQDPSYRLPLPEELEFQPETTRLSFQLLHLAKSDVPESGLDRAVRQTIDVKLPGMLDGEDDGETSKIEAAQTRASDGAIDDPTQRQNQSSVQTSVAENNDDIAIHGQLRQEQAVSKSRSFALALKARNHLALTQPIHDLLRVSPWHKIWLGTLIFLGVCALYVYVTPMAAGVFEEMNITWPEYQYLGSLMYGVGFAVAGTILPMIVGVVLFVRRAERTGKISIKALMAFVAIVFFLSLLNNFTLLIMQRIEVVADIRELTGLQNTWVALTSTNLLGLPEIIYILTHSLIPCIVVIVIGIIDPEYTLSIWDILATIVGITLGHLGAYYLFEVVAGVDWQYYWHQATMGAVLSTTALVTLRMFWEPATPRGR